MGVLVIFAAGNEGQSHFGGPFVNSGAKLGGSFLMKFQNVPFPQNVCLPFAVPAGGITSIIVTWSAWGDVLTENYDVHLWNSAVTAPLGFSSTLVQPVQICKPAFRAICKVFILS